MTNIVITNKSVLTNRLFWISKKEITKNDIENEIKEIHKLHWDFINFYNKQLQEFNKVKQAIKSKVKKQFENENKANLKRFLEEIL